MKILLFDYDGTIVNSIAQVQKGFNHASDKFGIKKRTKKQIGDLYLDNIFISFAKLGVPKRMLKEFNSEMRGVYSTKQVKPFPKIKEVLISLKKENKVIILTSNFKKIVRKSLLINKIQVDSILGEEEGMSKVEKINKIKRKYPKNKIFYIGDTAGDMKESRKAGVKNVAVTWGFNDKKDLLATKPDYIINKPTDLLEILG
jgi:phosphoglycolate phosphatase